MGLQALVVPFIKKKFGLYPKVEEFEQTFTPRTYMINGDETIQEISLKEIALEPTKQPKIEFKKGDKVRISEDSHYYSDQGYHGVGVVSDGPSAWIDVEFIDGYTNDYEPSDLEKLDPSVIEPRAEETWTPADIDAIRLAAIVRYRPTDNAGRVLEIDYEDAIVFVRYDDGGDEWEDIDDLEVRRG